jgi:hypothetical protein
MYSLSICGTQDAIRYLRKQLNYAALCYWRAAEFSSARLGGADMHCNDSTSGYERQTTGIPPLSGYLRAQRFVLKLDYNEQRPDCG